MLGVSDMRYMKPVDGLYIALLSFTRFHLKTDDSSKRFVFHQNHMQPDAVTEGTAFKYIQAQPVSLVTGSGCIRFWWNTNLFDCIWLQFEEGRRIQWDWICHRCLVLTLKAFVDKDLGDCNVLARNCIRGWSAYQRWWAPFTVWWWMCSSVNKWSSITAESDECALQDKYSYIYRVFYRWKNLFD